MINGVRTMNARPSSGDVVRDAQGNRFVVISCGMKYANVHLLGNPRMTLLVNLREVMPDTMPIVPAPPTQIEDVFEG